MSVNQNISSISSVLLKLQQIEIGGSSSTRIPRKVLLRILQNLSTLTSNGVSMPQALETLASDSTFAKQRSILRGLMHTVRQGNTLSHAMKKYPDTFNSLVVHQVQVGEQSGNLQITLQKIVSQLENQSKIKAFILKKLSYPAVLVVAGFGCVTFMLTSVIPTFQKMYEDSGAVLPGITQFLIASSEFVIGNSIALGIGSALAVAGMVAAMKNPRSRLLIDRNLLKLPVLGNWFRNLAVLQFVETLGNLLESGFTLADALPAAAKSVSNRSMQKQILSLHSAIRRGERFSTAISKEKDLFPPVVNQLVVVGERTGRLVEVTREIRIHLQSEVEKLTSAMLGAIEPLLTACLAAIIGGILLAVYLPMFDMIGSGNR